MCHGEVVGSGGEGGGAGHVGAEASAGLPERNRLIKTTSLAFVISNMDNVQKGDLLCPLSSMVDLAMLGLAYLAMLGFEFY